MIPIVASLMALKGQHLTNNFALVRREDGAIKICGGQIVDTFMDVDGGIVVQNN